MGAAAIDKTISARERVTTEDKEEEYKEQTKVWGVVDVHNLDYYYHCAAALLLATCWLLLLQPHHPSSSSPSLQDFMVGFVDDEVLPLPLHPPNPNSLCLPFLRLPRCDVLLPACPIRRRISISKHVDYREPKGT